MKLYDLTVPQQSAILVLQNAGSNPVKLGDLRPTMTGARSVANRLKERKLVTLGKATTDEDIPVSLTGKGRNLALGRNLASD